MRLKDQRHVLVDPFVNTIYLYDDKALITFTYKEGTQTVTFGEAAKAASKGNGSDLDCIPAPQERQLLIAVFFVYPAIPFNSTGGAENLNKAVTKRGILAELPGDATVRTEQFKSFSALDNHPLFAVY